MAVYTKETQKARRAAKVDELKSRRKPPRKGLSALLMIIAVVLGVLLLTVGFITDWMWFKDLGYTSVFWKKLITQLEIGVPTFIVMTLLARFYLRTLKMAISGRSSLMRFRTQRR